MDGRRRRRRQVYVTAVRALGRPDAGDVRVPGHKPGRPETLTDTDYANLLRVPDARTTIGRRDIALLRVLGDCGLRSAEMRGLTAGDVRRPRSNARHYELHVLGKGNRDRNVELPTQTKAALDAWLAVHPLTGGRGRPLRDEHPVFVRLGRHPGQEQPKPLSAQLVHKLINRTGQAAGIPECQDLKFVRVCHHFDKPPARSSGWSRARSIGSACGTLASPIRADPRGLADLVGEAPSPARLVLEHHQAEGVRGLSITATRSIVRKIIAQRRGSRSRCGRSDRADENRRTHVLARPSVGRKNS